MCNHVIHKKATVVLLQVFKSNKYLIFGIGLCRPTSTTNTVTINKYY